MKLIQSLPKTALLLSSLFLISVNGARKTHHRNSKSSTLSVSSPVTTPIVESDHVSSPLTPSAPVVSSASVSSSAQSRSSPSIHSHSHSHASERSHSTAAASSSYSQPLYSSPYDTTMMSESQIADTYFEPVIQPSHHHTSRHLSHSPAAAASGHYHHHVPAPTVGHARHAGAATAATVATSPYAAQSAAAATPYGTAAVPYSQAGYYGYPAYDYPAGAATAGGRYVAQGSHHHPHHHDAYLHKRAHGYGGYGWHPDLEIQTLFFIGIPLIIIPLLFLWPYFLYSLHYRGGFGGYGGYGGYGYRSATGEEEIVEGATNPEKELKGKIDELTKKIIPKLSKKADKTDKLEKSASKSSSKSASTKATASSKNSSSTPKSEKI